MENTNGHILYEDSDKDIPEAFQHWVIEGGLGICRICGAAESELSISCEDFQKGVRHV